MSINEAYVNTKTIYKVQRISKEPLGLNWEYSWYVESSLDANETDFYIIDGIEPNEWVTSSCVTITFNRTTLTSPYEVFNVHVIVKVIDNEGIEHCESVKLASVIVKENFTALNCTGNINIIPDINCIYTGEKYIYQFCCNDSPEYVYFTVHNGKAYDLTGTTQYAVSTDPIKVAVDTSDNCAEIMVSWNEEDPSIVYLTQTDNKKKIINVGPKYVITAFAEKNKVFSPLIIKEVTAMPKIPIIEIIGADSIDYNTNNTYTLRVKKLNHYPIDYYLTVYYRKRYDDSTWSSWSYLLTPILLSTIGLQINNDPTQIPYFYDIVYNEYLSVYEYGDPEKMDIEFKVELKDSYVEPEYLYEYQNTANCQTENTIQKNITLIHCPTEYDTEIGGIQYEIIPRVIYTDIAFNINMMAVVSWCINTRWILNNSCYHWCYHTRWILNNSCYHWCYHTRWILNNSCYRWIYCSRTRWWMRKKPCYTISINNSSNITIQTSTTSIDTTAKNTQVSTYILTGK